MRTLTPVSKFNCSSPQISPYILFNLPSLTRSNRHALHFNYRTCLYNPKVLNMSALKASESDASISEVYGGWDDLELAGESVNSGESDQLRSFLVSNGIDDKKYAFVFLLGLVCAFAISRVRFSSIVVFPASVFVFAIGFSSGFVRGGGCNEIGIKGSSKEEIGKVSTEKFLGLVDFFDGFDAKIINLKNDIQRDIDSNKITIGDLKNYVNILESMRLLVSKGRNVLEVSINNVGNSNQKLSRRKKEPSAGGFQFLQYIVDLFGEKSVGLSYKNKVVENVKQGNSENLVNDKTGGYNSSPDTDQERIFDSLSNKKGALYASFSEDLVNESHSNQGNDRRTNMVSEDDTTGSNPMEYKKFADSKEYEYQNNSRFLNNRRISLKMQSKNETRTWGTHDNLLDSMDLHMETESSYIQEQVVESSSRAYKSSMKDNKTYGFGKDEESYEDDESHLDDHLFSNENEIDSDLSPKFSDDLLFNKYLTEANVYLREAKDRIKDRHNKERADIILHKSAVLLCEAIALKPMSLLAVGMLGNTYLLHGEMKLHISHELRGALRSKKDFTFVEKRRRVVEGPRDQFVDKDKIASLLIDVCEECEDLLLKAGRNYKLALSIDGNDVRALYNWGLALSFRAQLIADIGPETALDADKVFMPAIDKFDAMMSKGNTYAPDALFRWGVALQQRSQLRPTRSKEKVKLLQQAKRLFEDALHMDSNNLQVREALSTCTSELNYRNF